MKLRILLLFFLIHSCGIKSQVVFCPPGAEWHYNYLIYTIDPQIGGYVPRIINTSVKYSRDSVVNNEPVKILLHDYFFAASCDTFYNSHLTLIKQKGDTVFMRNGNTNFTWQILYNFAAQVGDQWMNSLKTGPNTIVNYTTLVDSVGYVTINNMVLKRLYINYASGPAMITERLGPDSHLFYYGTSNCDGADYNRALCYQDNSFGLIQFGTTPCDYPNSVGISEYITNKQVMLYPVPADENLQLRIKNVELVSDFERLTIYDNLGVKVSEKEVILKDQGLTIQTQDLPPGIYTLRLTNTSNQSISKRFQIAR